MSKHDLLNFDAKNGFFYRLITITMRASVAAATILQIHSTLAFSPSSLSLLRKSGDIPLSSCKKHFVLLCRRGDHDTPS